MTALPPPAAAAADATRAVFESVQKALFFQQQEGSDATDHDDHGRRHHLRLLRYVGRLQVFHHHDDYYDKQQQYDWGMIDGERYHENDGGRPSSPFWSSLPSDQNGDGNHQGLLLERHHRFLLPHEDDDVDGSTTSSSTSHNIALIVLPKIAATLSLLASLWLILEISVYSKNKLYYVYHKLVLSMAVYAMLGSLWYWIGHWTTATDLVGYHQYESSASAFCRSQGFMLQISMLGTAIYFCMLFLYYVLVISWSYSEDQLTTTLRSLATANANDTTGANLRRRMSPELKTKMRQYCSWIFCSFDWERFFHLIPLTGSLATAVAALLLDLLYPVFGAATASTATSPGQTLEVTSPWCWIAPSTLIVYDGTSDFTDKIKPAGTFQWAFYLGPAWASFGLMLLLLFIVFRGVASQEQRMKKYVTTSHKNPKQKPDAARFTASFIRPKTIGGTCLANDPTNNNMTTIASISDYQQEMMMNSVSQTKNISDSNINAASSHSNSNSQPNKSEIEVANSMQISSVNQETIQVVKPVQAGTGSIHSYTSSLLSYCNCCEKSLPSAIGIPAFKEYWDHRPRTRQVVVQAMCYVGSFFWCNIFLTVNQSVASRNEGRVPYALLLLQAFYQPLLGFFILLSYRRPTYMRMRRTGKSRWRSLLTSMQWNSHPVEKPRQQRRISASSVAASIASRKRRKEEKRLKRERQRQLKEHQQKMANGKDGLRKKQHEKTRQRKVKLPDDEEQKRRASAPSGSLSGSVRAMNHDESRNSRSYFMNLINQADNDPKNSLVEDTPGPLVDDTQRSASAPVLPTLPPGDFGDVGSWESTLSPTDDSADADRNQPPKTSNNGQTLSDSFSTLSTRRQSELTKEGSSKQFRSRFQKEDSMSLGDLLKGQSSEELSFDLDDMIGIGIDEEEEEDISFEADDDDDDDDDHYDLDTTTNREDEESTVESLHESAKRRLGFNFFGRREPRDSFQIVKQQSERYMDLCAMDIIPEADGAIEEKWRQIESQSTRYERGKHDRYKLHLSVPIISDRNLAGLSDPPRPHLNSSSAEKQIRSGCKEDDSGDDRTSSRDSPRFGWSKLNANPLFKMSGRWNSRRDLVNSHTDQKKGPSPNTSPSSIGFRKNRGSAANATESSGGFSGNSSNDSGKPQKKPVGRTSSGGYFVGSTEKDRPDDQFWSKMAFEKSRKDVLKAISSRLSGSGSSLTSSEEIAKGFNKLDFSHPDKDHQESKAPQLLNESNDDGNSDETDSVKEARRALEDARRDLERNISMRELQEAMMVDQDYETIDQDLQLEMQDYDLETGEPGSEDETINRPVITKSNSGSRWLERARQDIVNTVTRLSNRSLDNIPEVSEHSHTDSPKNDRRKLMLRASGGSQRCNGSQRRISSGEFSNKRSSASSEMISESSNELSTVGSTRTLKRSNMQQRKSESSDGMSSSQLSAELSLVSDTPMSDDDYLSETSVDFNGDEHIYPPKDKLDHSTSKTSAATNRRNSGSSNSNGSSQLKPKNSRMQQKQKSLSRRSMFTDSCNSMERLSERSIEDYLSESSKSFQIDTSEMFKTAMSSSDSLPLKVDETVNGDNHANLERDNFSESSDDTEYA